MRIGSGGLLRVFSHCWCALYLEYWLSVLLNCTKTLLISGLLILAHCRSVFFIWCQLEQYWEYALRNYTVRTQQRQMCVYAVNFIVRALSSRAVSVYSSCPLSMPSYPSFLIAFFETMSITHWSRRVSDTFRFPYVRPWLVPSIRGTSDQ